MKHDYDYAQGITNAGAQEVPALKKTGAGRHKSRRGRDLRAGK